MHETGASSADGPQADPLLPAPKSFSGVILGAWVDLFRSRDSLLLKMYSQSPYITPAGTAPPATLAEAHARIDALSPGVKVSERDRDLGESRIARSLRILSAWLVFWSTLMPLTVIAAFLAWKLPRMQGGDWVNVTVMVICSVILFPLLAILSLVLQAGLMRPLLAVLNWNASLPSTGTENPPPTR
jgi:hypothetical protein